MGRITRFGVSLEEELRARFDRRNARMGYTNRSEAIRDLIRECIIEEEEWVPGAGEAVGVVSLVYDHDHLELPKNLTEAQHRRHALIVATTHVHLDAHNCLEVLILRGAARKIKRFGEELVSRRGVKHGKLVLTTTGRKLR
ncbi:MAG TPA: nickel-responsive transcriptional regulator NikR [Planctomycetota bacterium]|mgnify:FL=1|jgi:CopG family nickel-responsive transcriptional regulator|nr:nickel-responsive transcriptional regulator NikR [Planctomycetota bacterium]OQC22074.1 MAG: putative nickel-responsive regulator [Planctomycetes bacterium ADurb.Bin069]HNR98043.1 nickel-responsive transcriptional regulator NikR [Planctomycetota bacterium]HNU25792.1 nickel-responsive transcriptional regulator NikR [Planctomycetota bacterium]HOE28654.1 nickel-responsive transcriptional regulator NikR [Planctomycetota bacterium]